MDQDMIPILERDDDFDFYSPIWQYSNCHPKAPPPSPVPSADMQCSAVDPLGPPEIWEIPPLALPHKLSIASSVTAPSMVPDEYDISDEESGGLEWPEVLDIQWLPVNYDIASPNASYGECDLAPQTYTTSAFDAQDLQEKEPENMHKSYYGIANTASWRSENPRLPPPPPPTTPTTTHHPPGRCRNASASASHPTGNFSVFPRIPEHQREPFPQLPVERSVFDHDDDEDDTKKRLRLGSISSQIRLPLKLVSGERRRKLKRRASSVVHAIMTCGLGRKT